MPALRLFGPPSLLLADGRELALSAREAALLGWLHLEGPNARARLAGLLWPGGDEARARLETELAGLQRSWPADEAVMGLRRRVLMARLGRASAGEIDALLAELEARGLRPLLRSAHLAAARCAGARGDREAAAGHARRALAMAEMVDPWVDEFAAVWLDAAQALRAAGALDEAEAALADGRSWVEQAASTLENEEERRAWREGNATHRALLGRIAGPQG